MSRLSLLLLLPLLWGCAPLIVEQGERTTIFPPPEGRSVPPASFVKGCLIEEFTARISEEMLAAIHAEIVSHRTAWFEVPHDDSRGHHFHRFFVTYLEQPQVLLLGEVDPESKEVERLRGWDVPNPEPPSTLPLPPHPPLRFR